VDVLDVRTLLVYGMNGDALPVDPGFPLRLYAPNRSGMKLPKWIVAMETIGHLGYGYWVDRGWSAEAHPQIHSMIDPVVSRTLDNGGLTFGGIAWAGDRGNQEVEV
jgi:DMSO/TMAO reductase YedYZ molybdopterin-dependent catalytic subunit